MDKPSEITPEETAFLDIAKEKKLYQVEAKTLIETFNGDDRTFTVESSFDSLEVEGKLTFVSADSETKLFISVLLVKK